MHSKLQRALTALQNEHGCGTLLYPLEISRALNLVIDEPTILADLDEGYDIISYSRVAYSRRDDWIDILLCLLADDVAKKYVITFDPRTNELVSISCLKTDVVRVDGHESDCLPFALAIESHTTDVTAPEANSHFVKINTRRQMFAKALEVALLPVIGVVSPAAAITTTNINSPRDEVNQTIATTNAVTTPNDNDMVTDYNTDRVTVIIQDQIIDTP
jgi:hypothetical protein